MIVVSLILCVYSFVPLPSFFIVLSFFRFRVVYIGDRLEIFARGVGLCLIASVDFCGEFDRKLRVFLLFFFSGGELKSEG